MRIDHDGEIGIGTATPGYLLHVNGTAGKPGGGDWADSSDIRLKKNVGELPNALNVLMQLRGVTFEWRNPGRHARGVRAGFIAQEVERIFPDWVIDVDAEGEDRALAGEDGKIKALALPTDFNAYLVEAIRELKAKNDSLREELADLRERDKRQVAALALLQAQFEKLQSRLVAKETLGVRASLSGTAGD